MKNYKFTEVRLDLQRDEVIVVAAFQENQNRWQLKEYKFNADEEININELLDKTKRNDIPLKRHPITRIK